MPTQNSTIAVIAWKKLSTRSTLLARGLNAKLWFFKDNLPYAKAFAKTFLKTIREKPRIIIIQLPQGPLLLEAYFLKKITGCKIIADVHTGFLLNTEWKGLLLNAPFVKLLPTADIIVAHNETQLTLIHKKSRNKTIVVFDPWNLLETGSTETQSKYEKYIVFPASYASDEPLEEVINAINNSNINTRMYVTGNWKRNPGFKKYSSDRIVFTGFLSNEKYNNLLSNATAIITGTKREYTSLMSGWEAIAHNKPLAVTTTRTLKDLFGDYAVFYDYMNSQSIAKAINTILYSKPKIAAQKILERRTIKSLEQFRQKIQELH